MKLASIPKIPSVEKGLALDLARPIALYGAGSVGREVLRLLQAQGGRVICFLDHKKTLNSSIAGIPVVPPDASTWSDHQKSEIQVVVSIFNAYVDMPALHTRLDVLGWKNVTQFIDFYHRSSMKLGDRYWLTSHSFYSGKESIIQQGYGIWADEKSRELYNSILSYRFSGDYNLSPKPDIGMQYFPQDVPDWASPLRLIDCGAFDGDTIRQLSGLSRPVEAIAAFEPDAENYLKLAAELRQSSFVQRASAWPCGVWSSSSQLRFEAGQGTGSALSASGSTVIQCVSLDDALPGFAPSLIKMDIEGAEYAALLGARQIISNSRPGLAICLYHTPEHLWQIPLQVQDWGLDYSFYLRCHCYNGFELVMYAIPR